MPKHKSVAIKGDDLLDRVFAENDTPWRDVLRWNCRELDDLEAIGSPTEDQLDKIEELDRRERMAVCKKWWLVKWPEHVISPRYNSDASYLHSDSESEARSAADLVYAE